MRFISYVWCAGHYTLGSIYVSLITQKIVLFYFIFIIFLKLNSSKQKPALWAKLSFCLEQTDRISPCLVQRTNRDAQALFCNGERFSVFISFISLTGDSPEAKTESFSLQGHPQCLISLSLSVFAQAQLLSQTALYIPFCCQILRCRVFGGWSWARVSGSWIWNNGLRTADAGTQEGRNVCCCNGVLHPQFFIVYLHFIKLCLWLTVSVYLSALYCWLHFRADFGNTCVEFTLSSSNLDWIIADGFCWS